jgi:sugar lactone lactonase YvrE
MSTWVRITLLVLPLLLLFLVVFAGASSTGVKAERRSLLPSTLPPGHIVTVAGGHDLDGKMAAREASLLGVCGIAVDPRDGSIFFSDSTRHLIARIDADGATIEPFAGTQIAGFNGDGRPALETAFHIPCQLAINPRTGDVYVADISNYRVRVIKRDGSSVQTLAGIGLRGVPPERLPTEPPVGPGLAVGRFSGDGGPATEAELNLAVGLSVDKEGNVYIADSGNHRIRAVNTQSRPVTIAGVTIAPGHIQTVVGSGNPGSDGDGGPATAASLAYPKQVVVDPEGNLLIVDLFNKSLRRVNGKTGVIETLARGGAADDDSLRFVGVEGVAVAPSGDIYYSELNRHVIFRLDPKTLARKRFVGTGVPGLAPEGTKPTMANIHGPGSLAVGLRGELYFVDGGNNRLRKVEAGRVSTVAGGGSPGEGVHALEATFSVLASIAVSPAGDIYLGDVNLHAVRRISAATGKVETFAGTGMAGWTGDGGPPREAEFTEPICRFFPGDEAIYVADPTAGVVRRILPGPDGGKVETLAGNGQFGRDGDGGPATRAQLSLPIGVAKHPHTGEIYIASLWLPTIRKIDAKGVITRVAGVGTDGYSGDGGPALEAQFHWPTSIVFDKRGRLYVSDYFNNRIRVIGTDGLIQTYAGTGLKGYGGDGGPAVQAMLNGPNDLVIDDGGDIYFTDVNNHRIRKIDSEPPHRITTVIGTGDRGFSGDGGPAQTARLNLPRGLALGPDRILYLTDSLNRRVRAVRLE